jgi:hypothetical protein
LYSYRYSTRVAARTRYGIVIVLVVPYFTYEEASVIFTVQPKASVDNTKRPYEYFGIDSTHGIFAYQEEVLALKVYQSYAMLTRLNKRTQLALSLLSFIGGGVPL